MHSFDREEADGMSVKPFFARGRLMGSKEPCSLHEKLVKTNQTLKVKFHCSARMANNMCSGNEVTLWREPEYNGEWLP